MDDEPWKWQVIHLLEHLLAIIDRLVQQSYEITDDTAPTWMNCDEFSKLFCSRWAIAYEQELMIAIPSWHNVSLLLIISSSTKGFQHSYIVSTLNSPIIVGRNSFLESILILIMRINVGRTNFHPILNF